MKAKILAFLTFINLIDAKGRLSITNIIVINFVIALTYRMYVFESIGAGEVMSAISGLGLYGWKNARMAKEYWDKIKPQE